MIVIVTSSFVICLLYFISSRIKKSNVERRKLKEMTRLALESRLDDEKNKIKPDIMEDSSTVSEKEIDDSYEEKEIVHEPSEKISEEDEFDMRLRKLLDRK